MQTTSSFLEQIHRLPDRVNADPVLQRLGRFCSTEFLLGTDEVECHLQVERGRLLEVADGPFRMRAWHFAIRAPLAAWEAFWAPCPAVGFNDIFAMTRYGHARIDGDVGPLLSHLRYVKEVIALPRSVHRERES